MLITETKEVLKTINVVLGIKCDICKREFTDLMETQEFLRINFVGGFASVFGDMTKVKCDICQHCLKTMIDGKYTEEEV